MKKILLQKGLYTTVSDRDYESLIKYKWYAARGRNRQSYVRRWIWDSEKKNNRFISMHREIMDAPTDKQIDHINHDTLDNRRENLRICTSKENQGNEKISKNNTSGFKGVSWRKDRNKWRAYIAIDYKQIALGHFETKESASVAYNEAAKKYFGEFALLNLTK